MHDFCLLGQTATSKRFVPSANTSSALPSGATRQIKARKAKREEPLAPPAFHFQVPALGLEVEAQGKLCDARTEVGRRLTELRRIAESIPLGGQEVRMIEEVKKVGLELQCHDLLNAKLFGDPEVRVHKARTCESVATCGAIAKQAKVRRCRADHACEGCRVQEPIGRAFSQIGIAHYQRPIGEVVVA